MLKIFVVYDSKVEAYLQPFFLPTRGAAVRGFSELVADPKHQFGKYPGDYTMFEIGTYDPSSASIVMYEAKVSVGVGTEFLKS